ncbi:NB-ARC domain, LRR domain containing protein [Parasponia andersonii]|uniref:NB-ARC domain, LRR domain containing protein n=1 Tax=Parasponia andersonii TaxID=3476 RepID=A0A2P5CQM8_PARAD|nr:NB-ARC domain, LRR domain containing protein [Parasponia andersonii]
MAEGAVTFLLNKLASLVEHKVQLIIGGDWEEILILRWELEQIRALLRDADVLEESDEELKVWVKQVRDVAHDAEDVVDEFTLLKERDHGEGFYGSLHMLCHRVKSVKARYRIDSELQGINSRIRSIFASRKRLVHKLDTALIKGSSSSINSGNGWHDRRDDALLLDYADLVGVDGPKRQLVRWLVDGGSERQVVAVTGMGGMGKTALVKKVYDDLEVKKYFKTRVWIAVSQSFSQEELLRNFVVSLTCALRRSVPVALENMSIDGMKMLMKSLLQKRRYLVVLDDIWNLHEWEALKYALPNNNSGSRVMLTTRKADVAFTAASTEFRGAVYNLMPLSNDESWDLFCRKAFQGDSCPSYLFEICNDILSKCEGLPLAIVALSGVLARKDKRRIDEWDVIRRSLGAEIHGNDKLEDLKRVLFLSFNDLPYYLKSCFLYLSIFPEGPIKRMRMIRLWIAEGFVEAKEGRTLEEVAEDYLNELLNRNLIQPVATMKLDWRVKAYRVHGLFHEIIISKSRDQNFACIVRAQSSIWPERARRLSIHGSFPSMQQNRSACQLRSFFMFGAEELSLRTYFPVGFKLLRVLDMEGTPLKTFPMEVVDLHYLRNLSLRKTKVKIIPRSIGKLKNLETLDLKHTMVTELPLDILKLQSLRHLLVYRFETNVSYAHFNLKSGFKAFSGIGALRSLQQLCFTEADQACSMMMSDLGNLNQLRRLGIIKLRKLDGPALCSSIERMTNLRMLSLTSTAENEELDLQHLSSPPRFLERLYLSGRLEELPCWISSLRSMVKLFLKWSSLKDDPLVHLQDLPNLVHLELLQACDGDTLHFRAGKFKKLKLLGLDKFDTLEIVEVGKGAMPCLEKLIIQRCSSLYKVPSGVEHLTELKVIEFFDMPNELIMKLRPDGNGVDYWKVAHVPEVYSTYWRDGGWDVYSIESFRERETTPPAGTAMRSHRRRTLWKV